VTTDDSSEDAFILAGYSALNESAHTGGMGGRDVYIHRE